jgi:hypothetical protein
MNLLRYGETLGANCRGTFEEALKPFGLKRNDIGKRSDA